MKILMTRFSGGSHGGAEMSAADIYSSLQQLGHDVTFLNDASHFIVSPRPKTSFVWRVLWPLKAVVFYVQVLVICIRGHFDVLHPHSREDQIVLAAISRLLNIPVIWRDPGDLPPQLTFEVRTFWQKLNRSLQLNAIRHTDAIFTLNKDAASELQEIFSELDIHTPVAAIKSNVLFSDYDLQAAPPKGVDEKIVVGFMSRLEQHKGLGVLLDALGQLPKQCLAQIELWVVGDGVDRDKFELRAQRVEGLDYVFWGYREDVSSFLNTFAVFVQPSEFEGWGRTVKEAMYFGVPVIGTDVGGIAEQIIHDETGLLFPVGDSRQLASLLEGLVCDQGQRNRLGRAGQQAALNAGDWLRTVETEIVPLFEKYVKEG